MLIAINEAFSLTSRHYTDLWSFEIVELFILICQVRHREFIINKRQHSRPAEKLDNEAASPISLSFIERLFAEGDEAHKSNFAGPDYAKVMASGRWPHDLIIE